MTKSKFSFGFVYFTLLFLAAFMAAGVFLLLHPDELIRNKFGFKARSLYSGILITGAGIILLYMLLKELFFFRIYTDRLELKGLFRQYIIYKQQIGSIDLTGRENIGFMSRGRPTDAIVILLEQTDKLVLADLFYRNAPELKRSLQVWWGVVGAKDEEAANSMKWVPPGEEDGAETFAGNPLLSGNSLILYVCVFLVIVMLRSEAAHVRLMAGGIMSVMLLLLYFAFGSQMYYFKVSDQYLFIKNHFLPWYTRLYRIEDLSRIIFERPAKRSHTLRIITRAFVSKGYAAGSLQKEHWKALEERMRSTRVSISDEL